MKHVNKLIAPLALAFAATFLGGCTSELDKVDTSRSVFVDRSREDQSPLERYIDDYFGDEFNLYVRYKYEDRHFNDEFRVGPAEDSKALNYLNLIRYTFFDVYKKVVPERFLKTRMIRFLYLGGTIGVGTDTNRVGEATQDGVYVYGINEINLPTTEDWQRLRAAQKDFAEKDREFRADTTNTAARTLSDNAYNTAWDAWSTLTSKFNNVRDAFVQTIYHESAHTLHADRNLPPEMANLTIADYQQDNAFSFWLDKGTDAYLKAGFISDYASKSADEDFAELFGWYMVLQPSEWEARLKRAEGRYRSDAQYTGREIIERKLALLKNFLLTDFDLDIELVRAEAHKRMALAGVSFLDYLANPQAVEAQITQDFTLQPNSYYNTIPQTK